ncbi:MAG: DUF3783 domain-containing protein [Termitinemataceae bacterium]
MNNPVVLMHGFTHEQMIAIMRSAKAAAKEQGLDPQSIAFSSSTPTNLEWKLRDLIAEVQEEHEYMKQNPPQGGTLV